jgi:hypothetical protein
MALSADMKSNRLGDEPVLGLAGSETDEKGATEISGLPTGDIKEPKDFPFLWKLTALVFGVALSWGSSFSENTLGPLKDTLRKELKITNSQASNWDHMASKKRYCRLF